MQEIWKDIEGYEGLYKISNLWRVKSLNYKCTKKEKVLRHWKKKWYWQIILSKNNYQKIYTVHRIVGIHFIPNPLRLPCVCHKKETLDENGFLYNWADNLFWGTHKDNIQDMINKWRQNFCSNWRRQNFCSNWRLQNLGNNWKRKVSKRYSINQYTLEWELIKTWESCRAAWLLLWFSKTWITSCCNNQIKKSNWYIWKYVN